MYMHNHIERFFHIVFQKAIKPKIQDTFLTAVTLASMFALGEAYPGVALADTMTHTLNTPPLFANIPWGTSRDAVKVAMTDKGYVFDSKDSATDNDHDLWFNGTVLDTQATIFESFDNQDHLQRTLVVLQPSIAACKPTYDKIIQVLTQKYGSPLAQEAKYTLPYTASDIIPAVKAGKAKIDTVWIGSGRHYFGLGVSIERSLTIDLEYASEQWWIIEPKRRTTMPSSQNL